MKTAILIMCLTLAGCGQPVARYQLAANSDGSAWKIDTVTGAVWYCDDVGSGPLAYACVQAEQR